MLQGLGISLRFEFFGELLQSVCDENLVSLDPPASWYEVMVEDFLVEGVHHTRLEALREHSSLAFHSTGLNVGGLDEFDEEYLASLFRLYERYQPAVISDHLCWSAHKGHYHHDLLPIPPTYEALDHVCSRIHKLQEVFGRELCLENISTYVDYKQRELSDGEFLLQVVMRSGCSLLLDITNMMINHSNRDLDYKTFVRDFPMQHVRYMHLSGGSWDDALATIIDSHSGYVAKEDLQVLQSIYEHPRGFSPPVVVEWDSQIPNFVDIQNERKRIRSYMKTSV